MRFAQIKILRMTAFVTCLFFLTSELSLFGQFVTMPSPISAEGPTASAFTITLPPNLGTVEEVVQGPGPAIFHIQEAHGDLYSQNKIRKILEYLQRQYGIQDVFLEGDAARLQPEFLRFFPDQPEWTREAVEQLFKSGNISGPEAYLAMHDQAKAFPIEQKKLYESNLRAFKEVLEAREESKVFLNGMALQIKRLAAPYMSADLRRWISRLEANHKNQIPFEGWLMELKKRASTDLKIEIDSPKSQADWTMLVRVFTLQRIEKEFAPDQFQVERERFLSAASRFIPAELLRETKKHLQSPFSRGRLPFPETEIFFERLVAAIPANFDYVRYPQVMRFIGHLILQSELDAKELAAEIEKLQNLISDKLAVSPKEKEIVGLLKSYRLLEKLFALELTGEEYQRIAMSSEQRAMSKKKAAVASAMERQAASGDRLEKDKSFKVKIEKGAGSRELKPSKIIQKFGRLNGDQKVLDLKIENLGAVDDLYDKALGFYRLARRRDGVMLGRLEKTMAENEIKKAVVVTGGFHSQPFQQHFEAKGQSYVLITPAMKAVKSRETYTQTILKNYHPPKSPGSSTVRLFDEGLTPARNFPKGWSAKPSRDAMRRAVTDVLTRHQQPIEPRLSQMAFVADRITRSEVRSLSEADKRAAATAWNLFEAAAKKFVEMMPGKTNFESAEASVDNLMVAFDEWNDYSQDNLESSFQIKTQLSLGLDLFFGLIRWIYWAQDEAKYARFIFAADQIGKRLMDTQTLQLRKELRLPSEHGMMNNEERVRLAALEPGLLTERFDLLADTLKSATPLFFIWRETLERVRPNVEKLPLTQLRTFEVEWAGRPMEFTIRESVIPPDHKEFKKLRQLLSVSGMTWLRNLAALLSSESRSKDPTFKAHVRKGLEDLLDFVKLGQDNEMDPIRHLKEIASELDRDDEWYYFDDVLEQLETKVGLVIQSDTSEAVRQALVVLDQGVKSIRAEMAPQRAEVRNWVFKNVQLSDTTSIKKMEREIWRRGSVHYLQDVMQPQHFGAAERRRVQIYNPAGLWIASWPVGEFSTPKGARKDESLLSDLLLDEAEVYLKDLIHPDMDMSETRVSLAERNDEEGSPWFDVFLSFPDNPLELPSGVFREVSRPENQDFHELFLNWYPLLYVRHEMPIEEMELSAQRLEKVGVSNDPAAYRQAALERIGETAYFIRDELALNKTPEEIAVRVSELLEFASQDFIKSGDGFQKDEPLWAGKGYPDYGMTVLRDHSLALVNIMASLYGRGKEAKSEVRVSAPASKLFNRVEGDASIPLAIRYLDLFFQLAEEKVAVENQTGDRDFGFEIPRKGSRVSYTPPGAGQVLLLATDFRFPGGDQDHIVMESDYPIWLEFQKGTGVLEAIYIAADKDGQEYLKLEILHKKRNRSGLEPFNALLFLSDFKMQGPLIVESLLKQIPTSTKNELVLRASVVEADRVGLNKRSEVRSSPPAEQLERYGKLTNFYAGQTVKEGMNWDGTLFVPSPMGVLPMIFKEIERTLGKPLENKNYLALGAGLLHDSLYAASVEGMNVKAIERDSALSKQAEEILSKAKMQKLVAELQVRFFPGEDAFDQSWEDVDVTYFFYTQSGGNRAAYRADFEKRLLEKLAEMKPGSVFAMLFTGSQLMAEQADFDGLEPYFHEQVQVSPERTGLYLRTYKIPEKTAGRSEVRRAIDTLPSQQEPPKNVMELLTSERLTLAEYSMGHLMPLDVRAQYGEEVFRAAIHVLLLKLEPEDVSHRPVLAPEITEHIRATMPEFYRMISMRPLGEARRLLEDAAMAVPADVLKTEMLLPMIALLAARPDLEYTLILEGDGQTAEKFRQALKLTVKNSKLGFNPFDLTNFKVVPEADASDVRRLVSQSLSKTQGATAVVSTRDTILDPLNAIPNLALVLVKNPLRQRDASLLTAAFIDELVQSGLVRYDEDSLAQQVHSQSLLLEVQALQAFLVAA